MKQIYKEAFDRLHAPDSLESAVFQRIHSRQTRLRRAGFALCALVAACGTLALAGTLRGGWLNSLIELHGAGVPESCLISIGQTAKSSNAQMTLAEAVCDGQRLYLRMEAELSEGDGNLTPQEGIAPEDSLLVNADVKLPDVGFGMSARRLDDASDPRRAQFALIFRFDHELSGQEICLCIESLELTRNQTDKSNLLLRTSKPFCEGPWTFRFTLNEITESVHYTMDGSDVSVSALGLTIYGPSSHKYFAEGAQLLLTDGSHAKLRNTGLSLSTLDGIPDSKSADAEFDRLIDPSKARTLITGGTEYPLSPTK